MKKYLKKRSLSKDYFIIFGGILVTIMLLSIWHTWSVYSSKQNLQQQALFKQGNRIERELSSSLDYVAYLMNIIGKQIINGDPNDLERITKILQGKLIASEFTRKQFSWEMFDWSKPDKKIIASTSYGILKNPIDVSYRNYAKMADKQPWVIHFDNADVGVTSGQWIIPAGMGISDDKGNMVGILSMGFNIAKLTKTIEESIDKEHTSFVVLDENNKITMHSSDNNFERIDRDYFKPLLKDLIDKNGYGTFGKEIEYNGVIYSSYLKGSGYPYTILVGYNKDIAAKEFRETLMPGIVGYSIIGLVSLILLLIIRKLIISPVIRLSVIADKISKGEQVKHILGGRTYEINNLALQLMKVKNSLSREQKIRQKQRELLKIIRDSDNEKELFLRELYYAMNSPLNVVIAGAELMKIQQFGNNIEAYKDYIEMISNAGRQIESYTTDILNPSSVDMSAVIERCVTLQKKKASEIRLKINVNLPEEIPAIMADELRMRQVIISILGQAIFCIQDFGTIQISANVKKTRSGKPSKLIITIVDDGLGVSEEERIEQWERAFGAPEQIYSYSRNPDITRLSFPVIRHLIRLHHGSFELKTTPRVGSVFTITLPYLTKKELEKCPKDASRPGHKIKTTATTKADNIILFPGG